MPDSFLKDKAAFQLVGTVDSEVELKESSKGLHYVNFKVNSKPSEKGKEWGFYVVAFAEAAEEITSKVSKGDRVDLRGELSKSKGKDGSWNTSLVVRRLDSVEATFSQEEVNDAYAADEVDGIPW